MGKGSATRARARKLIRKRAGMKPTGRPRKARVTLAGGASSTWDMGPDTQAQNAGKIIEDASWTDEKTGGHVNPNGVKRARRIDLIELYHRKGIIDRRQMIAGLALRVAFEGTQRTAPAIKPVQVDSTPKPDRHVEIMIDRIGRFADISEGMNANDREILDCVALNDCTPAWLKKYRGPRYRVGIKRMQEALDRLADGLGL